MGTPDRSRERSHGSPDRYRTHPTVQLLAWVAESRRSYAETIEVWKTSCPRLSVWEDALADELVRVTGAEVSLTAAGQELLEL